MDLKQLFSGQKTYSRKFDDVVVYFTLRKPTNQEDLDYRRKTAKVSVKKGGVEMSQEALDAPIWLFDKLRQKIEYANGNRDAEGNATREPLPEEFLAEISNSTKLSVVREHLDGLEGEQQEKLGN